MKTTVIYHSADYDGIFCREIARKFLPDAELIGWDFGDPHLAIPEGDGQIYVMDLPVDRVLGWASAIQDQLVHSGITNRLIWIDHHASSMASHPGSIPGYRIDGVAACRLAWFYFNALERYTQQTVTADFNWFHGHYPWASKQDFVERKVSEPLAVRLAGEYDIWDKRDPDAETFQFGLRSRELTNDDWAEMLRPEEPGDILILELLRDGKLLQTFQNRMDVSIISTKGYIVEWEGLTFLTLNTARFNSLTFAALDMPETGHDALLGYCFTGKHWTVSLYHAKHRTDLDLSQIAVKHGGGGHKGACGFTCPKLPF
jgi:hypothetical protein